MIHVVSGKPDSGKLWPRSSSTLLYNMDGRQRNQARNYVRRSDDYGYNIANEDGTPMTPQPDKGKWTPGTMHIHEHNATILHLPGIDHKKTIYRYQGRDFRLTDVHGHVIDDLIA